MIAVYMRVSTDRQDVASQRHAIEAWIAEKNYDRSEIEWYEEPGVSGRTLRKRPIFQALLADAQAGKIQRLISFEISRIGRNYMELLNIMKLLHEHKVVVELPGKGVQAFDSAMDQFLVSVSAFTAAQFSEMLSRHVRSGMKTAKDTGYSKTNGRGPGVQKGVKSKLGYRKPYSPILIKQIGQLRARGISYRMIAKVLNLKPNLVYRIYKRYQAPGRIAASGGT